MKKPLQSHHYNLAIHSVKINFGKITAPHPPTLIVYRFICGTQQQHLLCNYSLLSAASLVIRQWYSGVCPCITNISCEFKADMFKITSSFGQTTEVRNTSW